MSSIRFIFAACLLSLSFACSAAPDDGGEPIEEVSEVGADLKGGKGQGECMLKCAAPPDGCYYEGAVLSGKCNKLTCGTLVCEDVCSVLCAAPPDGCHYEGALTTGPCSQVTCGTLVCDGSTL